MRCRKCNPVPEEVRAAADLLGRRSMLTIVYAAHSGAVRFNEFKESVGRIPPNTLAERLKELEAAGILERRVLDARPPVVEYRLTERGLRLKTVVDAMRRWATV
jgi:DNA-binding HxlR family transcriptional regulator